MKFVLKKIDQRFKKINAHFHFAWLINYFAIENLLCDQIIMYKGLIIQNDILKIYRSIQYSKNIFKCNMVKNIFKIYQKVTFLLKKIISV